MLIKFEIPALGPEVILKIKALVNEADVEFKDGKDKHKKEWVMKKALPLLDSLSLPKIPPWLVKPIKEAAVSIVIDTVWAIDKQ
jgi:hypothetical protein